MTKPFVPYRELILHHLKTPETLVRIVEVPSTKTVWLTTLRPRSAHDGKPRKVSRERLPTLYEPYLPCRWELHCLTQATEVIPRCDRFGCEFACQGMTVCAEHAVEHREWRELIAGLEVAHWPAEPLPECWCRDVDIECGEKLPYCPRHGTEDERGTEFTGFFAETPEVSDELAPR